MLLEVADSFGLSKSAADERAIAARVDFASAGSVLAMAARSRSTASTTLMGLAQDQFDRCPPLGGRQRADQPPPNSSSHVAVQTTPDTEASPVRRGRSNARAPTVADDGSHHFRIGSPDPRCQPTLAVVPAVPISDIAALMFWPAVAAVPMVMAEMPLGAGFDPPSAARVGAVGVPRIDHPCHASPFLLVICPIAPCGC